MTEQAASGGVGLAGRWGQGSRPQAPPNRGRLLTVDEVREQVGGDVSTDWIYANVPHKVKLSHRCVRWYEYDIRDWLEGLRESK